jgi:hypothetical protein
MSEEPAPCQVHPDPEDLGLGDLLHDAIRDLQAAQRTLERMAVTPEQARAVEAVRAALAELRAVVPPDDWPRDR